MRYRLLDAWAEREQRRFDRLRAAPPRVPGTESTRQRVVQALLATIYMLVKCAIVVLSLVGAIAQMKEHSAQSLTLSFVLLMFVAFETVLTIAVVQARRRRGRNWLTALAPRVRTG